MTDHIFTDPATGRRYAVDPNGNSRWIDAPLPPMPQHPFASQQPPPKKGGKAKWIIGAIGVFVLLGIIGNLSGANKKDTAATKTGIPSTSAVVDAASVSKTTAAAASVPKTTVAKAPVAKSTVAAAPATTAAPKDEGTLSQQNALRSAQSYISLKGFSRLGLIEQLSSSAGEGFPEKDAIWAVDHLGANWNEQAVRCAQDYLKMQGFSRKGLIEQLSSSAGEKFTVAQATYAVNKLGL